MAVCRRSPCRAGPWLPLVLLPSNDGMHMKRIYAIAVSVSLGVGLVLTHSAALGQPAPPAGSKPQEVADSTRALHRPTYTFDHLQTLWRLRCGFVNNNQDKRADEKLQRVVENRLENGIHGLDAFAASLIRESRRKAEAGQHARAATLLDQAEQIAPGMPEIERARASGALAQGPFLAHRWVLHRIRAFTKTLADFQGRVLMLSDLILSVLVLLTILGGAFMVTQLVRYGVSIYYDLGRAFPKGVKFLLLVTALLFCVLPLYYGIGPFLLFAVAAVVIWSYQNRSEHVVAVLFTLLLGVSPWMLRLADRLSEAGTGTTQNIFRLTRNSADSRAAEIVEAAASIDAKDWAARLVLGVTYKRRGKLDEAAKTLNEAIPLVSQRSEALGIIKTNLGNVRFATGHIKAAERLYLEAHALLPKRPEPAFNLSRLYQRIDNAEKSRAFMREATDLSPDRVGAWSEDTETTFNRFVRDIDLPEEILIRRELSNLMSATPVASRIWVVMAGPVPEMTAPLVATMAVILFGVLTVVRRRMALTRPCLRCARPVPTFVGPPPRGGHQCDDCDRIFVQNVPVDRRIRFKKEESIARHTAFKRWGTRFAGVLLPGLPGLIRGLPIRGLLVLGLALLLILRLLLPEGVLIEPFGFGRSGHAETQWTVGFLVLVWLVSAVRAFQTTRERV